MRDWSESLPVVTVDNQPRHRVGLVGDDVLGQERRKREIGQRVLRSDALLTGLRGLDERARALGGATVVLGLVLLAQ